MFISYFFRIFGKLFIRGEFKMSDKAKTAKKKTNVFNDGVKNADEKGNIDERLNMPVGSKRPLNTSR